MEVIVNEVTEEIKSQIILLTNDYYNINSTTNLYKKQTENSDHDTETKSQRQ